MNRPLVFRSSSYKPRAREGWYSPSIRQQVLGLKLAYWQIAPSGTPRPHDPLGTCDFCSLCSLRPLTMGTPKIIIILGPPPAVAYPFIIDVEGYPQQIINATVVIGLFWLRYHKPDLPRPFKGLPQLYGLDKPFAESPLRSLAAFCGILLDRICIPYVFSPLDIDSTQKV